MAATAQKAFRNYVDGDWVHAAAGETFESRSPATGELIGTFPKSGAADVDRAALDVFSEWKSVYVYYPGRLQKTQIDTAE